MAKYVKLSAEQKEEIRRLTQLANRRIKQAFKVYEAEGRKIAPKDVTGGIQTREQWASKNYALSRSVRFESEKEYRKQLHFLRQFEFMRPTMTEYTEVQREKTLQGMQTVLGDDVEIPKEVKEAISKANAPQLSKFWKAFSDKAARMGMKYSSNEAATAAMTEVFLEDVQGMSSSIPIGKKAG